MNQRNARVSRLIVVGEHLVQVVISPRGRVAERQNQDHTVTSTSCMLHVSFCEDPIIEGSHQKLQVKT